MRAVVLEASDGVGGRVRTDEMEGFRLDRGFQVLLEAYPEAERAFDYGALDLRRFYQGALVRRRGRFLRVADPLREPLGALRTLPSGVVRPRDVPAVLRLARRCASLDELWARPEVRAEDALRETGLSPALLEGFFRPFLGGITLDRELGVSSRFTDFVLRMFAGGRVSVPAGGMGALSAQLATRVDVRLGTEVVGVDGEGVRLGDGARVDAAAVVVACEGAAAARLVPGVPDRGSVPVTCVYFDAPASPVGEGVLMLDGDGEGPVNNLAVMSDVAPGYAPAGRALVSASVLGEPDPDDERLVGRARAQLRGWFGPAVDGWRHLRTYRIHHAQPAQPPGALDPPQRPLRRGERLWVCGDHRTDASINGALGAGRRAAEEVAVALREG